jgi:outer membrane lipoprotein carrier protein
MTNIDKASKDSTTRRPHKTLIALAAVAVCAAVGLAAPGAGSGTLLSAGSSAHAQDTESKDTDKEGGQGPADMSADDVAERVQKFYKKTKDYHADFEQTYTDAAAGDKKKSQGTVYFKKPGKMRWDYYEDGSRKAKKLLVSNGADFWIYEVEFKQVFKKCLSESQLPTSLKFLMGQGELLKEFNAEFASRSTPEEPVLELVPKEPTSKYTKLIFELDPKTFQVEQTTIFDPYGNTNEIRFKKAKINKNLKDNGFDFKPPKGARLLNPQKKCEQAQK